MIYVFGECELDTQRQELRRQGAGRHVEPQVFDVLLHLVEHRDRLVPKEELLDSIWKHRFVTPATLNSRIKAARQAVGDDGAAQRLIRTIRGRGFRFVGQVTVREEAGGRAAGGAGAEGEVGTAKSAGGVTATGTGTTVGAVRAAGAVTADGAAGATGAGTEGAAGAAAAVPGPIARDVELGRLGGLLESACAGRRQLVFITGESGIGKSTLAEAFLARAPASVRIARGQCLEQHGPGEPYLPVLDALGRLCRGPGGSRVIDEIERCAPSWLAQMPSLVGTERLEAAQRVAFGATRDRMLREVVDALEAVTRDTPLALLLEDIHWSDPSTLDLIVWLARHPEPARLLVIATFRPDDADVPLRAAVGQALRGGLCTEIPLGRWREADLREYCALRYPSMTFRAEVLELAHQRTEGNPLFVQTLLDAWVESGALEPGAEGWRPARPLQDLAAGVPDSLQTLLDQRFDRLSVGAQRILEAGSVVGSAFSAALVATALGREEEEVERRCDALARRGGLLRAAGAEEWPDGTLTTRFAFSHHLVRDAIYARVPLTRRTRLHLKVGERLEAAHGVGMSEQVSELALHFRRGRDDGRAVSYLRLAAQQAFGRSAHREAAGHLTAALEILGRRPDLPDAPRQELTLQRMLGSALLVARGWGDPDAEHAYARARELSEQLDDKAELARVLYGLAYLHEIRGHYRLSERLLKKRLRLHVAGRDPALVLETHELLSCSLFHQGDFSGALENANRAREVAGGAWSDPFLASIGDNAAVGCHYWAGLALWFLGFPDQALAPVQTALDMATSSQLIYMQAAAEWQMARVRLFRREAELAADHADRACAVAERQGFPYPYALALAVCGRIRVQEGKIDAGLEQIRRGIAMQEEMGADMEIPYCFGLLAEALLEAGRASEGLEVTERALAAIARRPHTFFWEAEIHRLRGELLRREGAAAPAERSLRLALTTAARQEARSLELRAAMSLCRLESQRGTPGEGPALVADIYSRFTEGLETPDLREAGALARTGAWAGARAGG